MSSQTQVGCFSFKKQLLHIHIPSQPYHIYVSSKCPSGDGIFFHYYWCDSSSITKNTNLLQDRFDKNPFTCDTPTRFLRQKGTNPSGVSRFRLRELPRNPQKSIKNDGIRMSICIYYYCLAERNYSSPPFSFHIWSPSICRANQSRRISCGKSVNKDKYNNNEMK